MADNEYDVVVVGSGASGLSAGIRAHDLGLRVVVLEAYTKFGGSTAFSAGQVWAGMNHLMRREGLEDTFEETRAYVKALNDDPSKLDEDAMDQWIREAPRVLEDLEKCHAMEWEIIRDFPDYYYPEVTGSKAEGRYLAAAPLDGRELGDLRSRILYSPHHPPGPTYGEMFKLSGKIEELDRLITERQSEDLMTMGTGVAAHLLAGLGRRKVELLSSHRATKLIVKDGSVTGVECETPNGVATFTGTVILASGSYDWSSDLVKQYSAMDREVTGSVAPPGVRGDGHRMAREIGAKVVTMPFDRAMHIPGYFMGLLVNEDDNGFRYGASTMGFPHSIFVDRSGKRFCDDSYYRSVVTAVAQGRGTNPFYLIWDEDHHQKYGLPPVLPGQPYPSEMNVASASSLRELAGKLNIDVDSFLSTVEQFNKNAREGKDPDFHRGENDWAKKFLGDPAHKPSALLGAIERAPFFGMQWRIVNTGIGNAGVKTALNAQALDTSGKVIPGLYAIGVVSSPTMMGTGYNSGFSVCRGLVYGYLAVEHIASKRSGARMR